MTEEFCLSEKLEETRMSAFRTMNTMDKEILSLINTYDFAVKEDVKKFIKKLKKFFKNSSMLKSRGDVYFEGKFKIRYFPIREIDKLAGEKLI